MAKPLRPKRGTTAKNDAFTGLANEITIDTDKHSIRVHDGVTAGGHEILPNCLPKGGGEMTGGITFTGSDGYLKKKSAGGRMVAYGGTTNNDGSSLYLYGKDHGTYPSWFALVANNGSESTSLQGKPSGDLLWGGNEVITSAGGTFKNDIVYGTDTMVIRQSVSDKYTAVRGGNSYPSGASLVLYGKDATDTPGAARFIAHNGTTNYSFYCYPDGRMTWVGRNLSSFAMPSGEYTAWTFSASGTVYTAPSDGWVQARMNGSKSGMYLMLVASNGLEDAQWVVTSWDMCRATVPVKKGDTVTLSYNCDGTNGRIRFYPANGVIQ